MEEKIISLLRNNARLSMDDIAAELAVESSVVADAVKEMEKSGVIRGLRRRLPYIRYPLRIAQQNERRAWC